MQAYSDPKQEKDPYALPDLEVWYHGEKDEPIRFYNPVEVLDIECREAGWYYWFCFPGCLPHSDPHGPFKTQEEALADAREGMEEED